MIFSNKTRIEEHIIEILDNGAMEGPSLLHTLNSVYKNTTKQALYKALRKLVSDEVINKQGSHYSLNRYWLQRIHDFASRHVLGSKSIDVSNVLNFENGDSVSYTFKNPFLLDLTWGHLYDIIYEAMPTHQVMLNYHPHEWLILSRTESEKFWLSRFVTDKKIMCFSIGNTSFLDRKFQKEYGSDFVKVNLNESYGLEPNQYLAVLGDYVFEVTTDPAFEKHVHEFFTMVTKEEEINQKQITTISKLKYRSKLKLSKNKKKADMWRTKFSKDFYIPKPYYLFPEKT